MVFWYTNSLLASLVSIFGCVMVITAIQEGIWGAGYRWISLGRTWKIYQLSQRAKAEEKPAARKLHSALSKVPGAGKSHVRF